MKPLAGTRILTLEQFGAAPYGTMFLADLGAEVIKVENPAQGGDASRAVGPHMLGANDSQYFQGFNLSKRSVALNLKTPHDRERFLALVATADAVVNNLRGDLPTTLGVDYASLRAANPAIVCLHISAYGRDNSRRAWPGYDFLMQAEAGLMSVTGEPDGPPSRMGVSMIDYMTGMTGMVGLLSCILGARQSGRGCDVDASLFDVAIHQHAYAGLWFLNSGEVPRRAPRSAHASVAPVQTLRTADGWIYVMCMKDKFWEELADRIGRPELKSDPRFATQEARRDNRASLTEVLDAQLETRTTAEWLQVLAGALPVAPIYDVDEAFASPFMAETGMVRALPHPARPDFRVLANPLKIDGARLDQAVCPPLGADTDDIFGALDRDAATTAAPR
jgi:crotonobetainyl-CoA:carnitine CoA-transferase CaiB-like acyl-CoA transferase